MTLVSGSAQDEFLLHTNINYLQLSSTNNSLSALNVTTHTCYLTLQVCTAQRSPFQPSFRVTPQHTLL
jgi:hypothetical protein